MFRYTVSCTFDDDPTARAWVAWLREEHIADVLAAGASSAAVLRIDGDAVHYEVRYAFASRESFAAYAREHAPRLREEGLARFPLELGLRYGRTTGEVEVIRESVGPQLAEAPPTEEPAP